MATATAPLNTFLKFRQFAKLEDGKEKDDKPTVWGISTWEEPDSDNECCDYETAVPVYQAWSSKALKRTKHAGQDPSLGNVRIQHGSEVGGKVTKIEFNDKDKEIWLGSEPISDDIKNQLKQGFYTGYSQGGSYAWRACSVCEGQMPLQQGYNFCETCGKNVPVRYGLKRIAEVSYVDSPATGEGFEHVKANGSTEILKFQKHKENIVAKTKTVAGVKLPASSFAHVGDPEKTDTWKLPIEFPGDAEKTKRHIRNALARIDQTKGLSADELASAKAKIHAAAAAHGIDAGGEKSNTAREMLKAEIDTLAVSRGLEKGMYAVGRAAEMLESLSCLWEQSVWEREIEGDDSEVPDELKDLLESFAETFLAMATEEAKELAAQVKGRTSTGEKAMTEAEIKAQQELEKAAKKSLASHFAKKSAHHEQLADLHEKLADHHEKAAENMEECMGKAATAAGVRKAAKLAALKASGATEEEIKKADTDPDDEGGHVDDHIGDAVVFHKSAAKVNDAFAKKHDKMAEHYGKMAESTDEESAKAVKAECAAVYKAEQEADATAVPAAVEKKVPTLDDDIKKARESVRNSQEYKDAIAAIGKSEVDAEIAALKAKTLAPLGTEVDKATADAMLKGIKLVPRDENKDAPLARRPKDSNFVGM